MKYIIMLAPALLFLVGCESVGVDPITGEPTEMTKVLVDTGSTLLNLLIPGGGTALAGWALAKIVKKAKAGA